MSSGGNRRSKRCGGHLAAMKAMVYPSGRRTDYGFDAAGRVNQVTGQKSGGTVKTYLGSVSYAPHGAMSGAVMGPVSYSAQFNNRRQPTYLGYLASSGSPFQMTLTYPAGQNNGNMTGQTVYRGGQYWVASFGYDEVNRLSSANESGGWSRGYGMDRWGNQWVNSWTGVGLNSFTPVSASNFAVGDNFLRVQGSWATGCGEMGGIGGYGFQYNGEGLLASITLNGGTVSYLYDGKGRRVVKRTVAGDTVYVRDAGGELAAEYGVNAGRKAGTRYVLADALGSTRATVREDGTVAECFDYLPYGEEVPAGVNGRGTCFQGGGATAVRYTGKERDAFVDGTGTGLDYFGARYFSGAQGRFTSADAPLIDQDPADPQSWNLYSYVRNNPLIFTDPTGRCKRGDDGKYHDSDDGPCVAPGGTSVTVTEKAPKARDHAGEADAEMMRMQYEAWRRNQERNRPKEDQPLPENARKILTVAYLQTTERLSCLGVPVEFGAGYALLRGGQPVSGSKPFVTPGSSIGTSPISGALRGLNLDLPVSVPTPVGGPGTGVPFRFAGTKSLGAVFGRYAPFAGIGGMGLSVAHAGYCVSQ